MNGFKGRLHPTVESIIHLLIFLGTATSGAEFVLAFFLALLGGQIEVALICFPAIYACLVVARDNLKQVKF